MTKWIKNLALKWAIKFLRGKINEYIQSEPVAGQQLKVFWMNIYAMSANEFLSYCTNEISGKNFNQISFPTYLKDLISPLRDDVEEVINTAIDGMDPRR